MNPVDAVHDRWRPGRGFRLGLALCVTAATVSIGAAAAPARLGVNMAGPEFSPWAVPGVLGVDYTFNDESSFQYFAAKGLLIFRVPILWERLQPTLSGALDSAYLSGIQEDVAWAKNHGAQVILDLHNYARYRLPGASDPNGCVIDNPCPGANGQVTTDDFVNVWQRLSAVFKNEAAVYAYGLMNEPHDLGTDNWKMTSQSALSAIRNQGDAKLVFVGGDGWSSARFWQDANGASAWIQDPANNFLYEAHEYFDSDYTGNYALTYDQELAVNPNLPLVGAERLQFFVDWCHENNVRGFLGEFGIPGNDTRWNTVLDNFLAALTQTGFGGTYWAAGTLWGGYPLSIQPVNGQDKPQLPVLLKYALDVPARPTGLRIE